MLDLVLLTLSSLFWSFRTQAAVQAEIIALRHQLVLLRRTQNTKRLILRRAFDLVVVRSGKDLDREFLPDRAVYSLVSGHGE